MDRLYGNPIELSTKASIVDPVDFISGYDHDGDKKKSGLFIGRNNTEIWAHAGSNVVFDCLVGRPDIKEHGPVSFFLLGIFYIYNLQRLLIFKSRYSKVFKYLLNGQSQGYQYLFLLNKF